MEKAQSSHPVGCVVELSRSPGHPGEGDSESDGENALDPVPKPPSVWQDYDMDMGRPPTSMGPVWPPRARPDVPQGIPYEDFSNLSREARGYPPRPSRYDPSAPVPPGVQRLWDITIGSIEYGRFLELEEERRRDHLASSSRSRAR
jgi:hypothetical protein